MKYIIEIKPEYEDSFKGVMILGAKDSNLFVDTLAVENLEVINSDYINEHFGDLQDTAYQKGFEDGKKEAESSEVIEQAKVDAFNKGMLHKGEKIHDAYQRGLDDAWECARKIVCDDSCGGMSMKELLEIFNKGSDAYILRDFTAQQAIEMLKAHEKKQDDKIEVGDIVNVKGSCNDDLLGVVTKVCEDNCYIMWGDGSGGAWCKKTVVKTGKHIDVDKFLGGLSSDN